MTGPVIYTYRAAEPGLYVNSYLVEGESTAARRSPSPAISPSTARTRTPPTATRPRGSPRSMPWPANSPASARSTRGTATRPDLECV